MSKEIVELFAKTINKQCHLKKNNRKWQLLENDITIEFQTPNNKSYGFSLDVGKTEDVFGFFGGKPPKGIAKMCDGIITLKHKEKSYIFLIEQKTNNKNYYKKQLINGWHFCQWLLGLFGEHKHYNGKVKYIGLLYRNRKNISKEPSTHSKPDIKSEKHGIKFFETNEALTHLKPYLEVI